MIVIAAAEVEIEIIATEIAAEIAGLAETKIETEIEIATGNFHFKLSLFLSLFG